MTLTENEYIWAVSTVSGDDGTTNFVAYFTDHDKADKHAACIGGRVVQTTLWKGSDGRWYRLPFMSKVLVDAPTREEALKKLTDVEREVLGI